MRLYDTNLTMTALRFSGSIESPVLAGVQANETKIVLAIPNVKTLVVIRNPNGDKSDVDINVSNAMQDSGFRFMVNHQTTGHVFPVSDEEQYQSALEKLLPEISEAISSKLNRFGVSGVKLIGSLKDESTGHAQ